MVKTAPGISTRDAILDACDRLMARFGFRKMTMDDLAAEAKISKRTIYHHFASKEHVGLSSIGRVVDQVLANMAEIAAKEEPVQERLHEILLERVMGRVHQVKDYYHSLDELFEVVRPAYMDERKKYFDKECALIAKVIAEGQKSDVFVAGDAAELAKTLILATIAFLPYSLSVKDLGKPKQIEKDLRQMIDLLIRGLMTPGTNR